jgi:hypothetical protein
MKAKKTKTGQEVSNYRRRKDESSEGRIDSAAHNQILKQKKN